MGPLLAEMKATRVNQEGMKVTIKARQEQMTAKMPTNREEMKAMMEAWLEKIKASQEKLEANQEKIEHAEAHTFLPPSRLAVVVCEVCEFEIVLQLHVVTIYKTQKIQLPIQTPSQSHLTHDNFNTLYHNYFY